MGKGAGSTAPNLSGARRRVKTEGEGREFRSALSGVRHVRPTSSTFAARHIGPDSAAVAAMLAVIGVDSLDELAAKALPPASSTR